MKLFLVSLHVGEESITIKSGCGLKYATSEGPDHTHTYTEIDRVSGAVAIGFVKS